MDFDDFLGGEPNSGALAESIDQGRPAICFWVAHTIAARYPKALRFRSVKGRRAWEQDIDWLLRRLHEAMLSGAPGLGCDRQWLVNTLLQRGVTEQDQHVGAMVLQEALLRRLGAKDAADPIARIEAAFEVQPPPSIAQWIG